MSELEIEVLIAEDAESPVTDETLANAAMQTLDILGVQRGHLAIEVVGAFRIHELNREHRGIDKPTDVLSFPVDGEEIATEGPPQDDVVPIELGDIVINPEHTEDMVVATVHGVLHLCGYDHEVDDGEMLDVQDRIVDELDV